MKTFLLNTYYLDLSGSSTFIQTLAQFLKSSKYNVLIFAIVIDPKIKTLLKRENIEVVENLEELKNKKIDYIISQHTIPTILVRSIVKTKPLFYISHGILSELERTPSINLNISWYFAVSEEIKKKLIKEDGISPKKISIIRNFIDVKRFNIIKPINHKIPKKILFISSRYTKDILKNIKEVCLDLKIDLTVIGKKNKKNFIEKEINNADLVISLGRGVIESLSCGRPAIVYDYQGGDGIITKNNYKKIMQKNFSGRTYRKYFNKTELKREIKKYDSSVSNNLREIVLKNFNISIEGNKILNKILNHKPNNNKIIKNNIPHKEMVWLIKRIAYFAEKKGTITD